MKIEKAINQKTFESNLHRAVVNILFTGNWLRDAHQLAIKPFGLLPQHYNVLRILKGRYPLHATPGEIKSVMLDKGNDLTRLLDKIEKQELIARHTCPENRRKMNVSITEKGLNVVEQISQTLKEQSRAYEKNLSEKEAETLSLLLDKMRG
jgi:DNA-binding MarR family transcriptional regulator